METVKTTENYTIFKKKSGRYGVKASNRKWINGPEKVDILTKEGLIKISKAAAKPAEEEAVEAASDDSAETAE